MELKKKIAVGSGANTSGGFEGKNFGRRAISKPPEALAPAKPPSKQAYLLNSFEGAAAPEPEDVLLKNYNAT